MRSAPGSRADAPTGWWVAGALLLALAALLAWTAWQNQALRGRVAGLERENRALAQALAARAAAAPTPGSAGALAAVAGRPPPAAGAPAAAAPFAPHASLPASSPARAGPLEEALQRLRAPVASPGASPFGHR